MMATMPGPDTPRADYTDEQLATELVRLWALVREQKEIIAEARGDLRLLNGDIDVVLAELTRREEARDAAVPAARARRNVDGGCAPCDNEATGEYAGMPICASCLRDIRERAS